MKRFTTVALAVVFLLCAGTFGYAGDHAAHWSYEGKEGPEHWGDISKSYEVCKTGKSQSPIDLPKELKTSTKSIGFNYRTGPIKTLNNGHTIQVNVSPGSTVTVDGKKYNLLQFHFHSPSEHVVGGTPYEMEVHLVHKNDKGELAVVGVFMKEGKENPLVKAIWANLPDKVGEEKAVKGFTINPADLLPADYTLYRYSGSLTTPPCSEKVSWNVLKANIEVSKEQTEKFLSIVGRNARPVQPVNERTIE
ncbi:MAG: carbonic anhydrase [Nitrospirae bacterium]|uniref:carbonic anhydrase n=1 Tax=Candidatus Magnetobacterium casense TaxID=1455061 RepID=UPI000590D5B6|nr:carbonic anhydrase [Candidatus Magnetobacterium casensis]MBF0337645.1 carbonic anhydrase [Nitrospirota bacterium]